ncbi:hypothetical protein LMH87_012032 [Akanthomyces muscarius]|uniref:HMG box domain-containing protein n=1 Tax=Akanthomyces muscarius TaxID=2231603 RepID=A0A9W8ULR5_AKAMU|nr:hypothetical protein LMH87_012032 [Akanthomyces muscarius]KAJ4151325.1 hypothetical protein LMH87_012032 [Akanthomyces muscarius]
MGPGPSSRQSALPMKTREIPSYASNHILRASQPTGHSNSVVHPAEVSRQALVGDTSPFLSIDTGNAMPRTPRRPIRDAGGLGGQSKERRVEKRNAKPPSSEEPPEPLSIIAQRMSDVAVTDVATFANRSVEVRQSESMAAGKVKRPLNAFILYRKAYQEVAKTQCNRKNSHQQVSSICGASWNAEPPSVLERFRKLAKTEKQMHEDAFPTYKYDPVQAKKPKDAIDQDSRACDASDGESNGRTRRSGRQRTARGTSRGLQSQLPGGPWSQYQALPFQEWYTHGSLPAEATQYTPRGTGQRANDQCAGVSYSRTSSDLPFQPYSTFIDPHLDPSLQAGAPKPHHDQFLSGNHDMLPDWMYVGGGQDASTSLVPDLDIAGAHTAYLQGTDDDWQVEQLEDGSHFSDWMTQAGTGEQQ